MKLLFKTTIDLSYDKVQERFNRDLFVYLSPKLIPFELKRFDGTKKGNEIHIDLGMWVLKQEWVSLITFEETNSSGWSFIDGCIGVLVSLSHPTLRVGIPSK